VIHPVPLLLDVRAPGGIREPVLTSSYRSASRPSHIGADFLTAWLPGDPTGGHDTEGRWTFPEGVPALAAWDGVVTRVTTRSTGDQVVRLDHGNGLWTEYVHLRPAIVQVGQAVRAGQPVGVIGYGKSVRHLHFNALRDGAYIDPEPLIRDATMVLNPWQRNRGVATTLLAVATGGLLVTAGALFARGRWI